jgi:hypothetical protein
MMARSDGDGWLLQKLESHVPRFGKPPLGRLAVYSEEDVTSKQMLSWDMRGKDIMSTDRWKRKADPYCIIHRTKTVIPKKDKDNDEPDLDNPDEQEKEPPELECTAVFRTEVSRRTATPSWDRFELSVPQLCHSSTDQEIIIMVYDWFRVQEHRYIGECVLTYKDLMKAFRDTKPIEVPICVREGKRLAGEAGDRGRSRSKGSGSSSRSGSKLGDDSSSRGRSRTTSKNNDRSVSKLSKSTFTTLVSAVSGGRVGTKGSRSKDSKGSKSTGSRSRSASHESGRSSGDSVSGRSSGSEGSKKSGHKDKGHFGRLVGHLSLENVGMMRRYSFLDYIRGGLELKLAVAIDFSRSNATDPGGGPENSYHCINPQAPSAYTTAMRSVGDIMKSYDADDKYPVYGFGARLPPSHTVTSDCFALTGDFFDPEVQGVDGIIQAYQRALRVVRLHGPTRLQPIIKHMVSMAQSFVDNSQPRGMRSEGDQPVAQEYFVLLILTDGRIDDQEATVEEVMLAANLPISIIIVGVGNADFTFVDDLANNIQSLRSEHQARRHGQVGLLPLDPGQRDIVHFVAYDDFRDRPWDVGSECLKELPREVVGYYEAQGIKPNRIDKFEDKEGNPLGSDIPKHKEALAGRKVSTLSAGSGIGGRKATNLSTLGGNARKASTLSGVSKTSSTLPADTLERLDKSTMKKKSGDLPPFIMKERERIRREAETLGYEPHVVGHGFREGLPAASIEILVDNIVNGGHGKAPCFREAIKGALQEDVLHIPGQIPHRSSKTISHRPESDTQSQSSALRRLASVSKGKASELGSNFELPSRGGTKDAGRSASIETGQHSSGADAQTAALALLGQGPADSRQPTNDATASRAASRLPAAYASEGPSEPATGQSLTAPQTGMTRTKSILARGGTKDQKERQDRTRSKDDRGAVIRFDFNPSPQGQGGDSVPGGLLQAPDGGEGEP